MKLFEDVDELQDDIEHAIEREAVTRFEDFFERRSFDVFLDNIGAWRFCIEAVACFVEFDDARDVERREDICFAVKERVFFPVFDGVDAQLFDGDFLSVGMACCEEDFALSAGAEFAEDGVFVGEFRRRSGIVCEERF